LLLAGHHSGGLIITKTSIPTCVKTIVVC
jgi:hypothetical protein